MKMRKKLMFFALGLAAPTISAAKYKALRVSTFELWNGCRIFSENFVTGVEVNQSGHPVALLVSNRPDFDAPMRMPLHAQTDEVKRAVRKLAAAVTESKNFREFRKRVKGFTDEKRIVDKALEAMIKVDRTAMFNRRYEQLMAEVLSG